MLEEGLAFFLVDKMPHWASRVLAESQAFFTVDEMPHNTHRSAAILKRLMDGVIDHGCSTVLQWKALESWFECCLIPSCPLRKSCHFHGTPHVAGASCSLSRSSGRSWAVWQYTLPCWGPCVLSDIWQMVPVVLTKVWFVLQQSNLAESSKVPCTYRNYKCSGEVCIFSSALVIVDLIILLFFFCTLSWQLSLWAVSACLADE